MPSSTSSTTGWITRTRTTSTPSTLARQRQSSLPHLICSPTLARNNRHHGTLIGRWSALSLSRPSSRPFSQSSIISTQSAEPINKKLPQQNSHSDNVYHGRFREFNLAGKVHVVTGGAQGLGLSLAEALVEAGSTGLSGTLYHHRVLN